MKLSRFLLIAGALLALSAPASAQVISRTQPPSTAAEASRVVCAQACVVTGFQVNTGGTAGWLMLFDAVAAPADGASQTPLKLYQVAVNTTLSVTFPAPLRMTRGAVLVFSSTGPFTKTDSATAQFSGDIQ